MAPTMLRVADVADRWSLGRATVYRMLDRGELACRRIGGVVRIPLAAVEAVERGDPPCPAPTEAPICGATRAPASTTSGGLRLVGAGPEARAIAILASLDRS